MAAERISTPLIVRFRAPSSSVSTHKPSEPFRHMKVSCSKQFSQHPQAKRTLQAHGCDRSREIANSIAAHSRGEDHHQKSDRRNAPAEEDKPSKQSRRRWGRLLQFHLIRV